MNVVTMAHIEKVAMAAPSAHASHPVALMLLGTGMLRVFMAEHATRIKTIYTVAYDPDLHDSSVYHVSEEAASHRFGGICRTKQESIVDNLQTFESVYSAVQRCNYSVLNLKPI